MHGGPGGGRSVDVVEDSQMSQGGMQLKPEYRQKLNNLFLAWYLKTFTNTRMGFIHWPVGNCRQNFQEYHQVVALVANGGAIVYRNTPITEDTYKHTSGRNTNSWATAIDGFGDATTTDLGTEQCKPAQIQLAILTLIQDCINLHVPVGNLMSHAEAADMDDQENPNDPDNPGAPPYGPKTTCERWDFYVWINPKTLELKPAFDPCPEGWLAFMDYIRGEVILGIQKETTGKW